MKRLLMSLGVFAIAAACGEPSSIAECETDADCEADEACTFENEGDATGTCERP